jgi:hypothetical protein
MSNFDWKNAERKLRKLAKNWLWAEPIGEMANGNEGNGDRLERGNQIVP